MALAFAGRTTAGRTALDAAVQRSTGLLNGRILLRRGGVVLVRGPGLASQGGEVREVTTEYAAAGVDELLGLASSLIRLGTTALVAGVVLVNDLAAVPLMVALHRRLRTGAGLATALRNARLDTVRDTAGDPVATATGWSFTCLGAG